MPRWVKVSGLVAGGVILLAVGAMLVTGGEHGPGRHGILAPSVTHIAPPPA
jgi:hypothetical protein